MNEKKSVVIFDPSGHAAGQTDIKPLFIGPLRIYPPLLQAPMAGFTNYAFRQILRRFGGVGLPATEMLSARGVLEMNARGEDETQRLWGIADEPRPLAVQIWDNDPGVLAAVAARLTQQYAVSVVDINFGCPAPDVSQKAQSGSYLLQFPRRMEEIVHRVAEACRPTPVTAKIRLGPSRRNITAVEAALAVEAAGAAALTVHGRTAADMYRGRADWEAIARVKQSVARIPVVGNGDIASVEAAIEAFRCYGVDGVMIGRAALSRPWLFSQIHAAMENRPAPPEPPPALRESILLEHYRLIVAQFGAKKGTIIMRRYAARHACGLPGAKRFRAAAAMAKTPEEFAAIVQRDFPKNPPQALDTPY
jgi:tRNA-dihydrouridine synthase B